MIAVRGVFAPYLRQGMLHGSGTDCSHGLPFRLGRSASPARCHSRLVLAAVLRRRASGYCSYSLARTHRSKRPVSQGTWAGGCGLYCFACLLGGAHDTVAGGVSGRREGGLVGQRSAPCMVSSRARAHHAITKRFGWAAGMRTWLVLCRNQWRWQPQLLLHLLCAVWRNGGART